LACFEIGLPAHTSQGGSHGQSKEACCDAQEKLETRQGKRQAWAQEGAKRATPKKAKSKVRRAGSGAPKPPVKKKRPPKTAARKAPRKTPRQVVVPVEDTIIDVIEEPVPGTVVVTEYESIRTATPISSGPEPQRGAGPETEEE
jgi:hypothetical protein